MKIEEPTIDDEWSKFMSSNNYDASSDDEDTIDLLNNDVPMEPYNVDQNVPKASNIYISTKTKISYLNTEIDLKKTFWLIPMIEYATPSNGVIKKQMKFNSSLEEELNYIHEKLKMETSCYEEHIITNINNPTGRIKFKDIRKVTIGVSKKDIMSCRCKKKSAFYNCIVLILRLKYENMFKEFHVKIFNTGKLEIPGIQNETSFNMILSLVVETLQPFIETKLSYNESGSETVLINSNFKCGYFINREKLYDILKFNYNIQSIYDPCSYPGIQCKFYYNPEVGIQTGSQISENNKKIYNNITQVSFMIFRTGSVLIVGKCDESVLLIIYEFIKNILTVEHRQICQNIKMETPENVQGVIEKKKKIRKRQILITGTNII